MLVHDLPTRHFEVSSPGGKRTVLAWLVLLVTGGQFLLPILFVTVCFSRVKRHPVFLNFCACMIITSVLSCIMFYHDKSVYDDPTKAPSDPVCLVQAALVHQGVPPLAATAVFTLIYHVWTRVSGRTSEKPLVHSTSLRTAALMVAPYLVFAIFGLSASVIVLNNLDSTNSVIRLELYCELRNNVLSSVRSTFTGIMLLLAAFFEVRTVIVLRRQALSVVDDVDQAMFMRVVVFGVYVVLGIALSLASLVTSMVVTDIYISTLPLATFLVFAWQKDILDVWCFWRREEWHQLP
ncbi:hypothetical protein BKA62DRAFT_709468 [Auriculariales sp. MPI-PUGE-AT-0066]|nr:hypothetical protein BKA62DRAFT_709468 [Auriculariales sp. MPI-PUGE-AT-0066]